MDAQARVTALAALQLASGATDEEWEAVMERLRAHDVPDTSGEVVADVRRALAEVRAT